MPLTDEQQQNVEGILDKLDDLLDKRFAQARRITPSVKNAETDMRLHQMQIIRGILSSSRAFGPIRFHVCDILAGNDETKKHNLFDPVHQISLLNEVVPEEKEGGGEGTTAGRLSIRTIKAFYCALDPSLESVLTLIQTWIWWDLRDAAALYRFDLLERRINKFFEMPEIPDEVMKKYREEMGIKPGTDLTKEDLIRYELAGCKFLIEKFTARYNTEDGYQMIVVSQERGSNPEADAVCIRLAKRLMGIEKLRAQGEELDETTRKHYAQQLRIAPETVTAERARQVETQAAGRERQKMLELLTSECQVGDVVSYKEVLLRELFKRLKSLCDSTGLKPAEEE